MKSYLASYLASYLVIGAIIGLCLAPLSTLAQVPMSEKDLEGKELIASHVEPLVVNHSAFVQKYFPNEKKITFSPPLPDLAEEARDITLVLIVPPDKHRTVALRQVLEGSIIRLATLEELLPVWKTILDQSAYGGKKIVVLGTTVYTRGGVIGPFAVVFSKDNKATDPGKTYQVNLDHWDRNWHPDTHLIAGTVRR